MNMHNSPNINAMQLSEKRRLMVQQMRVKLAGHIEVPIVSVVPPNQFHRENRKFLAAAVIVLSMIFGVCWVAIDKGNVVIKEKLRFVERLSPPALALDVNRQLLYWTFALYDMDRLRKEFTLPKMLIVDSRIAKAHITELMPKADTKTLQIVQSYQFNIRKIP